MKVIIKLDSKAKEKIKEKLIQRFRLDEDGASDNYRIEEFIHDLSLIITEQ